MKKTTYHIFNYILLVLLVLFLSQLTLADINAEENSLTINIDYNTLQDDDNYLSFSGHSIVISNNGANSENITLSIINLNSDYRDFTLDSNSFALNPGETRTVHLSGKAPLKADQGKHEHISELRINTISGINKVLPLNTDVKSMLEINKIYVDVNENNEYRLSDDGDKISKLNPGDEIKLRFRLGNLFDEEYNDGNIDGDITVNLDDNDFGDEVDEEESFSIGPGEDIPTEEDETIISFIVPDTAEEGNYELSVDIDAKDDNGANYQIEWNLDLEVERNRNDLRIEKFSISPQDASCYRRVQILAKVTNFGTNLQKHSALLINNDKLGINQKYEFELDKGTSEDNSVSKELWLDLPLNKSAGIYEITATAYYNYDVITDRKITILTLVDCPTIKKETETINTQKNKTEENKTTNNDPSLVFLPGTTGPIATEDQSYQSEDLFFGIMIVAVVLLVVLIIIFFIVLLR